MSTITIPADVQTVLAASTITDGVLTLPPIDRPLYVQADKVLAALGGKWNRRKKGHEFAGDVDPREAIDAAVAAGRVRKPDHHGYFPTPPAVIDRMLKLADVRPGHAVLEPSAGQGAIAQRLAAIVGPTVDMVELRPDNAAVLRTLSLGTVVEGDFAAHAAAREYDRIVMNPPFERRQDARHVLHAFPMLRRGGRLVAVVGAGTPTAQDRPSAALRELVAAYGDVVPLPPKSFQASGTGVHTALVVLDRPEA
jgi:protein-L-isoaspartate O-methyltransferase